SAPGGVYISPYISVASAADLQSDASEAALAPVREAARLAAAAAEAEAEAASGASGGGSQEIGGEAIEESDEATASSGSRNCQVWWKLAEESGTLGAVGAFKCKHEVVNMEVELCVWEKYPGHAWLNDVCNGKEIRGSLFTDVREGSVAIPLTCLTGLVYTANIWAHTWHKPVTAQKPGTYWFMPSIYSRTYPRLSCHGGVDSIIGFAEGIG